MNNIKRSIYSILCLLFLSLNPYNSYVYGIDYENSTLLNKIIEKKITLKIRSKSMHLILVKIKKQTGINFIINTDVNIALGNLSVNVEDVSIDEALKTILANTKYTYSIIDNYIVISKSAKIIVKKESVQVEGKVVGDNNSPIIGATIIIAGTNKGAISDAKGDFKLTALIGQIIEVSHAGMVNNQILLENSAPVKIVLKKDILSMEDVVVTGYGTISRSSFTGNSVVIKKDELLKASKSNVIRAIQTFDPSFRIKENTQWGSDPNALPEVSIRGESGIGISEIQSGDLSKSNLKDNPNLPTFIMDGFEINVTKLYDMDPNRIESVTILKDAAATALYGSRAANGVVVITTVAPKEGKINISYSMTGEIVSPDLSAYNLLDAAGKLDLERKAGVFLPTSTSSDPIGDQLKLNEEYNAKLSNVIRGVDTYWLSQPLSTAFNHKHSLYLDGGSDKIRFALEVNYSNQDGVMKGSLRDKYNFGFLLQYNLGKFIFKNQVTYDIVKTRESNYGNFSDYAKSLPYNEFKDDNGRYLESVKKWSTILYSDSELMNPLHESTLGNYDISNSDILINNLSVQYDIMNGLFARAQLGITREFDESNRFHDPISKKNTFPLGGANTTSGELFNNTGNGFKFDFNAFVAYNKSILKHNINAQVGLNIIDGSSKSTSTHYINFPSGVLSSPNYAREVYGKPSVYESINRLVGFLTAINYSYDNIYLFDASARLDGSSAFGSDRRFAPFWSLGAGLNIHNYKILKDIEAINQLKIRASYGQTGKVNFPIHTARTVYKIQTDTWYRTGFGASIMALGNSNLTWESTNKFDVGFELGLFNDLIYTKFSYYNERTIDLVNDVTIPSSTGFTSYKDNVGEMLNKGYEIDLRITALRKKDIRLTINANLAHNENKILKISDALETYNRYVKDHLNSGTVSKGDIVTKPFSQIVEGESMNSIWGMKSLGINPADGNEIFLDANGNYTDEWNTNDQVILGVTDPKIQGSLGFNFTYKQFNIFTSFMYEAGGQRYNQTLVDRVENVNTYKQNVDERVATDRWTEMGDVSKYKKINSGKEGTHYTQATSRFVQDYNMLSWSSLAISYDLPYKIVEAVNMSMVRFEVGANDLFHLSTVKQERGLSYPYARTVNFSVKLSF